MKKIIPFGLILLSINIYSQTFYENAATETCECVKNIEGEIDNDKYISCLSNTFANHVMKEEKDSPIRTKMNTSDGIKSILSDIDNEVKKICNLNDPDELEAKKRKFYTHSENENARNSYIIAKDFIKIQKYNLAIEGLLMSLKEDDKNILALDDIAICYRRIDDYENAIKYYNKSLEIFPEGDFALMNIGVVYSLMEDYEKSNIYYQKLINYYPENPEGYFGYGKNLVMVNNFEGALKNIVIAHNLYESQKSSYVKDTELIITTIREIMIEEGLEGDFNRLAKENNIHFSE